MPKTNARWKAKDNEIIRRLKAGNGKVAGLKMIAAVDDVALMPVEVIGIDYFSGSEYHGRSLGISIHVKPIGGHGSIWIAPGELIDNTPDAIDLFDRKGKAAAAFRAVCNARSDRERRSLVLDMREKMNAEQRKVFAERLPDRIGESVKEDVVKAINKLSGEYEFKRIGELAAQILFDVFESPEWND